MLCKAGAGLESKGSFEELPSAGGATNARDGPSPMESICPWSHPRLRGFILMGSLQGVGPLRPRATTWTQSLGSRCVGRPTELQASSVRSSSNDYIQGAEIQRPSGQRARSRYGIQL
jgi:hypothetical protein